jgi:hypothetical protein
VRVDIPGMSGYQLQAATERRCAMLAIWRGDDCVLTLGVASEPDPPFWRFMLEHSQLPIPRTLSALREPPVPWLAARIEEPLLSCPSNDLAIRTGARINFRARPSRAIIPSREPSTQALDLHPALPRVAGPLTHCASLPPSHAPISQVARCSARGSPA